MISKIHIPDDFSFNFIKEGNELLIEAFRQMIIHQQITIESQITLEGDLILIN